MNDMALLILLVTAVPALLLSIVLIFLPFKVWSACDNLKKLIKEQEKTNKLLADFLSHLK